MRDDHTARILFYSSVGIFCGSFFGVSGPLFMLY